MLRRKFMTLTTGALLGTNSTKVFSTVLAGGRTQADAEGPYYPVVDIPLDATLLITDAFAGDALDFTGSVINTDREPLAQIRVEIWQCDGNSIYRHPRAPDPAKADPAFRGYGAAVTDSTGTFAFRTIVPVPYPGRPPHIHVKLFRSNNEILTTQLYMEGFKGDDKRRIVPLGAGEHYSASFDFVV